MDQLETNSHDRNLQINIVCDKKRWFKIGLPLWLYACQVTIRVKERTVDAKFGTFQEKWTNIYLFFLSKRQPNVCNFWGIYGDGEGGHHSYLGIILWGDPHPNMLLWVEVSILP